MIAINGIMLLLAIRWYWFEGKETEPLIAAIGQMATLLALIFEKNAASLLNKNVRKSKIRIKDRPGQIYNEDIDDSEINIS